MGLGVGAMYSYLQNGFQPFPFGVAIALTSGLIFLMWVGRNW